MNSAAAIILSTLALDIFVTSAAIGIAFFVVLRQFGWRISSRRLVPALLLLFAFLDLIWWPAAVFSSATFTIQDPELAAFFSVQPDTPLTSLLSLGLIDLLHYLIQAGVALWAGYRFKLVVHDAAA